MGKVIQCGNCGRTGKHVVLNDNIVSCSCCGADTIFTGDCEFNKLSGLRYLLAEKILYPVFEFEKEVDKAAEDLFKEDKDDFLAKLCHDVILREKLSTSEGKSKFRDDILALIDGSDIAVADKKGDLKCTVTFLDIFLRNKRSLDEEYKKQLDERLVRLKKAAEDKGLEIKNNDLPTPEQTYEEMILWPDTLEICDRRVAEWKYRNSLTVYCVKFSEEVEYIGDSAFDGCRNLKSVSFGKNIKEIGGSAFCGTGITKLFIPATLKIIGACAFRGCDSLTEVVFENAAGWKAKYFNGSEKDITEKELCGKMAIKSITDSKKYTNCILVKTN